MNDHNDQANLPAPDFPVDPSADRKVEGLAGHVLNAVAQRHVTGSPQLVAHYVDRLTDAVVAIEPDARDEVIAAMRRSRMSDDVIAEDIVPAAARRLGDQWCTDQTSFASVTIGVARLQAILHDLPVQPSSARGIRPGEAEARSIAVVALEDHTLGAMVLTRILRRHGASVQTFVGRPEDRIVDAVRDGRFDGIMISVASDVRVPRVKELADKLKRATVTKIPVIVGGVAIDHLGDPRKATGADYVESNPEKALELCGLTISPLADGRSVSMD